MVLELMKNEGGFKEAGLFQFIWFHAVDCVGCVGGEGTEFMGQKVQVRELGQGFTRRMCTGTWNNSIF